MKRIYLIDLDGVVVRLGVPWQPLEGAVERLRELATKGELWIFSCWALSPEATDFLNSLGVPWCGFIGKPLADEYVFIDDHLNVAECRTHL